MNDNQLRINEIYYSIQGESTHAGRPCIFIRLTGCHLRCSWCDSEYTFFEGYMMTIKEILDQIHDYPCKLVEITGGEPLLQPRVHSLMNQLLELGYEVLLETSGAIPITEVPPEVIKIVDIKCPGSGMESRNEYSILNDLQDWDELKFVIADRKDFDWSLTKIKELNLLHWTVLMSPVHNTCSPADLAKWILESGLPIRFQLQLHKMVWPKAERGV